MTDRTAEGKGQCRAPEDGEGAHKGRAGAYYSGMARGSMATWERSNGHGGQLVKRDLKGTGATGKTIAQAEHPLTVEGTERTTCSCTSKRGDSSPKGCDPSKV